MGQVGARREPVGRPERPHLLYAVGRAGGRIQAATPGRAARFSQGRSLAVCGKALSMEGFQ